MESPDGEKQFHEVWLKNVQMLIVPAVVMGLILLGQLFGPKNKETKSKKSAAVEDSSEGADVFLPKPSRLDTEGLILSPWRISSLTLDSGDSSGWFNLAYLVALFWLVSSSVANFFRHGHVFSDRGFFVVSAFQVVHELAVALAILYGLFSLAYVLQLVAMLKVVPYSVIIFVQSVLEAVLFLSALVYSISDDAVESWPFSQRLGLMMQASVFILKMHSYLAVNRKLALEQEAMSAGNLQKTKVSEHGAAVVKSSGVGNDQEDASANGTSSRRSRGRAGSRARGGNGTRQRNSRRQSSRGRSSRPSDGSPERSPAEGEEQALEAEDETIPSSGHSSPKPGSGSSTPRLVSNPLGMDYIPALPANYPNNVTFANFINFSFMPTLVYLPTYDMTRRVRFFYCVEKSLLGLGLLLISMTIVGHYVLPVVARMPMDQPVEAVANLIIPFICLTFCFFFIVFESILNFFAEVTRMADRTFYHDWWNATSYTAFSRDWNIPVSAWLRKHVYEELQEAGLSRETSRLVTFGISIVLHELVAMGVVGVVSPWLALFSVLQFPLFSLMRSSFFRGKRLGNLVFWLGLLVGVPLIAVLYAQEYCALHTEHCSKLKQEMAVWPLFVKQQPTSATQCDCDCSAGSGAGGEQ